MYEAIVPVSLAMCYARTSLSLDDHNYFSQLMNFPGLVPHDRSQNRVLQVYGQYKGKKSAFKTAYQIDRSNV